MAPRRPPLSLAGPLLTLPLLLSACGGTPFGDALSRSFSGASQAPAAPPPAARTTAPAPPAPVRPAPAPSAGKEPPASGTTAPARPAAGATPVAPAAPAPAVRPAPYRVTIRLPQADPSAPAEVVTKALRAAGVPFEVETIERMPSAGSGAAEPPVAPAGTANGPASATSRPAPAPR